MDAVFPTVSFFVVANYIFSCYYKYNRKILKKGNVMSNGLNKKKKGTSNNIKNSSKTSKIQRILALVLVLVMIGSMLVGSIFGLAM